MEGNIGLALLTFGHTFEASAADETAYISFDDTLDGVSQFQCKRQPRRMCGMVCH
jgi:hypothetical protein